MTCLAGAHAAAAILLPLISRAAMRQVVDGYDDSIVTRGGVVPAARVGR